MRIQDLLTEAQDYHKIQDPALRWLAQYTYENLNKWPGAHIIQSLLADYPAPAGIIYRGINFSTQDAYEKFMQQFNDSDSAQITFSGITSWSSHVTAARQFAITQPTYFLNREVMVAHDVMNRNKERLAGYRGIILSMQIEQGDGIDVDASGVGHESEIILPPGTYMVHIHEQIKLYAHELADANTTIDQVVQSVKSPQEIYKGSDSGHSFVSHVLHHHVADLSDASRNHLFKLLKPKPNVKPFVYEVSPSYSWGQPKSNRLDVVYHMPAMRLFDMYEKGVFTSAGHKKLIQQEARKIMKLMLPFLRDNLVKAERLDMRPLRFVAKLAGAETQLNQVMRATVGAEYARLQAEGRHINRIRDPEEQHKAMSAHAEQLQQLLQKIA